MRAPYLAWDPARRRADGRISGAPHGSEAVKPSRPARAGVVLFAGDPSTTLVALPYEAP
jgi:hypothetical protein